MITKTNIQYDGYGSCLEISNGIVRLVVTLDFGPRIIRYSFVDGENIFFEDKDRIFFDDNKEIEEVYGKDAVWYIYGGHRLWTSPEAMPRTYYPDNEPVNVTLTEQGAIFTPPVQKWNQYGYAIEVQLSEDSADVTVIHKLKNYSPWDVTLSLWPISVLSSGGTEVFPQPTYDAGFLANRQIAFWSYAKMTDTRLGWLDRYIILKQDGNISEEFKMGLGSDHGYALYFNHGDVFVKQFEAKRDGNYPDGGMSFETYTNQLFLEMETLSELKTIAPEETAEHVERWSLYKGQLPELSDDVLDKEVQKYLK